MPFKSEKQRRYMFANEKTRPTAEKWGKEYRSGGMIKKALSNVIRLPDLSRMRSGGMVGNGSKTPRGVVNSNTALCNKFRDS